MSATTIKNTATARGIDGGIALLADPGERLDGSKVAAMPGGSSRRGRGPRDILLVILALAALGGLAWFLVPLPLDAPRRRTWPWRTAPGPPQTIVLHGNVDVRQVELSFKVEGRIAGLAVDEGDRVETGQVLANLERVYFEDELRLAEARRDAQAANLARLEHGSRPEEITRARATVARQQAGVDQARLDFDRDRKLHDRNSLSRQEMELTASALRGAEAELEAAKQDLRLAELGPRVEDIAAARAQLAYEQAAVTQAQRRCRDSVLEAPGQGVILTRTRERGAIVKPGDTVFTLTLTTPVWVRAYVPEPQLGTVRPGLDVEVVTDGKPSRTYVGRVGYISPTAEFTPKAVETPELRTQLVYRTRIVIDNADDGLRQGMPVTVRIKTDTGGQGHGR